MKEEMLDVLKDKLYEEKTSVCIFGAGKIGTSYGYQLLRLLNVTVDYFSDNNSSLWNKDVYNGIKCVSPDKIGIDDIVFIMISKEESAILIKQELKIKGMKNIILYNDLMSSDYVIEKLFGIDKKYLAVENNKNKENIYEKDNCIYAEKVAVYTCITGEYDLIHEPSVIEENCDYYLISEKRPNNLKVFKWLNIEEIVPKDITDNVLRNRYCKMFGERIFKNYRYSIYIDGSCTVCGKIGHFIKYVGKSGLAMYRHEQRDCIYSEGVAVCLFKNIDIKLMSRQLKRYAIEGIPRHYGLFAAGVIVRDNKNKIGCDLTEEWFKEFVSGVKRDQISLMYVLWKKGLTKDAIGYIENGIIRTNSSKIIFGNHA